MKLALPSLSLLRERVSSSLWFVPGLIIGGSIVLAMALVELDAWIQPSVEGWPRLFGAGPEGAWALLSTVASSMITVAGVVFSITLVALSLTSSQYSSRVLRNFMRSRVNQSVLGTFLGIFSYCLVVLHTVRKLEDEAFVPALALLGGLLLGVVGILLLVYFIHHISTSIQASQILATAFEETMMAARRLLPDEGPIDPEDETLPSLPSGPGWVVVSAQDTGYLEGFSDTALLDYAREHERVLWVMSPIGSFVTIGMPLLSVSGVSIVGEDEQRLRSSFSISRQRTLAQDVSFGLRQLVDVALKALSPGVNDTTTAVMAVDYLGALLRFVAARPVPVRVRDDDGSLRLVLRPRIFSELVAGAFDQIRQNAPGNTAVLRRMLDALDEVGQVTQAPGRRQVLAEQLAAVRWTIEETVPNPGDREQLRQRADEVLTQLRGSKDARPRVVASS